MKSLPKMCLCFLLLGTILGNTHQFTVAEEQPRCEGTQYNEEELNKCCARCPPGFFLKQRCTASSDTQCLPCSEGMYAASWNYAERCRRCYPCPPGLVTKEQCSATNATVCGCNDGYDCTSYNGLGACTECGLSATAATEILPTQIPYSFSMNDYSLWIIPPMFLLVAIILAVGCYYRADIMRKIGRVLKFQKCVESTTESQATGHRGGANGCQADPLLQQRSDACTIVLPMQEVGKDLSYPIQETDSSQTGKCTLNST